MFLDKERSNSKVLRLYTYIDKNRGYENLVSYLKSIAKQYDCLSGPVPENLDYLIGIDIDRCLNSSGNKPKLKHILTQMYLHTGEYDQSMSYVATFLSCFVSSDEAISIMILVLDIMDRNIWSADHTFIQEDIYILQKLVNPYSLSLMKKKNIYFICFIKKYIQCLFITILDSEYIIHFLSRLFTEKDYLYKVIVIVIDTVFSKNNTSLETEDFLVMLLHPSRNLQELIVHTRHDIVKNISDLRESAKLLIEYDILEIDSNGDVNETEIISVKNHYDFGTNPVSNPIISYVS